MPKFHKMSESFSLPQTDAHVEVSILDGGGMLGHLKHFHEGQEGDLPMSSWAIYIHHPPSGRHLLWDVGLDMTLDDYPEIAQNIYKWGHAYGPKIGTLGEQLKARKGLKPENIDQVLFSHAHWDHCRPISKEFPAATGFFGPGTIEACRPGHFEQPKSKFDGRFFDPSRATERIKEHDGPWQPFGPFEKANDFFGDGSLWVIQAPGHMAGNLACCVRLKAGEWVLFASDCAHSRELLDGKYRIACWCTPEGEKTSLHQDIDAAYDTMARIRSLEKKGVHVCLAHDLTWTQDGDRKDEVLLRLLQT